MNIFKISFIYMRACDLERALAADRGQERDERTPSHRPQVRTCAEVRCLTH